MAAQVEVQSGEVGRTVTRGRLPLSPLTDSSDTSTNDKSLISPSISQSHIITPEPKKPVPGPKPRLTPKPFAVEKQATIKPIPAPRPHTKPRAVSTHLTGYKPDIPCSPKPQQPVAIVKPSPVSTSLSHPTSTSFKTSTKVNAGQTTKPVVPPFKPAPPLDTVDIKPTPPFPPERQKPKNQKTPMESGASIARAKSLGFLNHIEKEEEKSNSEAVVPPRPKPRAFKPRPVSAVFLYNAETPLPAPRLAEGRPLSSDLKFKFDSTGLSLHHKTTKPNNQESPTKEEVLPQKPQQQTNSTLAHNSDVEVKPVPSDEQTNKNEDKISVKEVEEDQQRVSVKSRINLLIESSSAPETVYAGQTSDIPSQVQRVPDSEPQIGVKQRIKQLTDDPPTQNPVLKPAVKFRSLPSDFTKKFSSETLSDFGTVSLNEEMAYHDIRKDPQRRIEASAANPSYKKDLVDFQDQLKWISSMTDSPAAGEPFSSTIKQSSPNVEVQTVRASIFDNIVETSSVLRVDKRLTTAPGSLSPSLRKRSSEDEGPLVTATFKDSLSPSSLRVNHTLATVQAVGESKAVSERIPSGQRENKAMTLHSKRSEGNRPIMETGLIKGEPASAVALEQQPRYLRIRSLHKWLSTESVVENDTLKQSHRETEIGLSKDRQREAEQEETSAAPKRLKTLPVDEKSKPKATYFALTGQIQGSMSPLELSANNISPTVPYDDFSIGSGQGTSQGKDSAIKRNLSLNETLGKKHQDKNVDTGISHISPRQMASAMDVQTAEKMTEIKRQQTKEDERQDAKKNEHKTEKQRQIEIEKQVILQFSQMKEREMQREFERQKAFEREKQQKQRQLKKLQESEKQRQLQLEKEKVRQEQEMQQELERERELQKQEIEEQREQELERQREEMRLELQEKERQRELERQQELMKLMQLEKERQKHLERQREMERQQEQKRLREKKVERQREHERQQELMRFREQEKEKRQELDWQQELLWLREQETFRQEELERQRELMRHRELEKERLRELSRQQEQMSLRELEIQRQQVLEQERNREWERQRQREEEMQRELDKETHLMEMQRNKQRMEDLERIKEMKAKKLSDSEKQKQLEKQRHIEKMDREKDKIKQMALEQELLRLKEIEKEKEKQKQQIVKEREEDIEREKLQELERQNDLKREKLRREAERMKEIKRIQLMEFEMLNQTEMDSWHTDIEEHKLRETMEKAEAEKMRQVAKLQEAERHRLKEKQRKEEQEKIRLEQSPLRPKVVDLDSVLRTATSHHTDPALRWKEPPPRPQTYKPAIFDVDSCTSQSQPSSSQDPLPVASIQEVNSNFDNILGPASERDITWKVPLRMSVDFTIPVWTMSPQEPWELQPSQMSQSTKVSPDHIPHRKEFLASQNHGPHKQVQPFYLDSFDATAVAPLGGVSSSASGDQVWLPRELKPQDNREQVWHHRRSQGSQELNRMRSRSMSRRSAPSSGALEGSIYRIRSRSAHREQDHSSWVQQKQSVSGEEEEGKDSETPVGETDSQYGTWETGLRTDDSLTPATPNSESKSSPSPRNPPYFSPLQGQHTSQLDANIFDGLHPYSSSENQPLTFPETPTTLLDNSALRSRVQLGKKRAPRTRPSRAARPNTTHAEGEGATSDNWIYRDSTEEKVESKMDEVDCKDQAGAAEVGAAVASQPQRIALFPGVDPLALKVQLKKRSDSDNQTDGPSPSLPSRSPKSPFLPRAARVLPPAGGKENGEEESPKWLKELKSKKRLSQYDNEN